MTNKRTFVYTVAYITSKFAIEKTIDVIAHNAPEAYDKATFEAIPSVEGTQPYCAYVKSVTYANGNHKVFWGNLMGKPY